MAKGSKRDRKLNDMVKAAIKAERKRMFDAIGAIDWRSDRYTHPIDKDGHTAHIPGIKQLVEDLQTAIDPAERERQNQLKLKEKAKDETQE